MGYALIAHHGYGWRGYHLRILTHLKNPAAGVCTPGAFVGLQFVLSFHFVAVCRIRLAICRPVGGTLVFFRGSETPAESLLSRDVVKLGHAVLAAGDTVKGILFC